VKLGVGGWSTAQGLVQLRRDVIPLHPNVVTVYYGWNDHWVAMGPTDQEIVDAYRLRAAAAHLRLAQLWLKLEVAHAAHRTPAPNRVPLPDYRTNLIRIATEARASGIRPVFITAPSNHVQGHEPAYLARRHLRSLGELVPLHTAYVNATREAAAAAGATVCDAAAAFASLPEPHDRYFQKDGIHLTDAGDAEMARVVSGCLLSIK
jgi:lysophospholipase L1-like esterase